MALAIRNEGSKVNSNINVTPMVDVMLVLLIIFMVITPMLQKGVSVDMAKVNNPSPMPDADKDDALLVDVDGKRVEVAFGRERDPGGLIDGDVFLQVALADRLLLTKTDLASKETIENLQRLLGALNPAAARSDVGGSGGPQ